MCIYTLTTDSVNIPHATPGPYLHSHSHDHTGPYLHSYRALPSLSPHRHSANIPPFTEDGEVLRLRLLKGLITFHECDDVITGFACLYATVGSGMRHHSRERIHLHSHYQYAPSHSHEHMQHHAPSHERPHESLHTTTYIHMVSIFTVRYRVQWLYMYASLTCVCFHSFVWIHAVVNILFRCVASEQYRLHVCTWWYFHSDSPDLRN